MNSTNAFRGTTSAKRQDLIDKVRSGEIEPEEARHIAVTQSLSELPDDLLPAIADLANIPQDRREWFYTAVVNALFDCWEMQENVDESSKLQENKSFRDAVSALKSASQALNQLDELYRQAFWWRVALAEQHINEFLHAALGQGKLKREKRRGRSPGTVLRPAFSKFVFQLLDCASFNGGNLPFEKHQGRGTFGSTERTITRQVREILRLKLVSGVANLEIARRAGMVASTVRTTINRFQAAGLTWATARGDDRPIA
jgi:DNA-directed RNA polymerase specialized sigma24 family protein